MKVVSNIPESEEWKVGAEINSYGEIYLYPYVMKGDKEIRYENDFLENNSPATRVNPPDWLDKKLGIDFPTKVNRRVQDIKRWCNKKNKVRKEAFKVLKDYTYG